MTLKKGTEVYEVEKSIRKGFKQSDQLASDGESKAETVCTFIRVRVRHWKCELFVELLSNEEKRSARVESVTPCCVLHWC